MADGREFQWSDDLRAAFQRRLSEGIILAWNKRDDFELMEDLLKILEANVKDAWAAGFEEGTGYGAYLEGGTGYYPTPVNPYLHYPATDGSVTPQTPPTTG